MREKTLVLHRPDGEADMERLGLDLDDLYANGLPQGVKIGFANLDSLVRLVNVPYVHRTATPADPADPADGTSGNQGNTPNPGSGDDGMS